MSPPLPHLAGLTRGLILGIAVWGIVASGNIVAAEPEVPPMRAETRAEIEAKWPRLRIVESAADGLTIEHAWRSWNAYLFLPLVIFFGILFVQVIFYPGKVHEPFSASHWMWMAVLGLAFFLTAYVFTAELVNSTTIRVAHGELTVDVGPLPCGWDQHYSTREVLSLRAKANLPGGNTATTNYIIALQLAGDRIGVVHGWEDMDQAEHAATVISEWIEFANR